MKNRIKVWVGLAPNSIGVYTKEFRELALYILKTALNIGMQEETYFLNVPCVTLQDNTERPETLEVGYNANFY